MSALQSGLYEERKLQSKKGMDPLLVEQFRSQIAPTFFVNPTHFQPTVDLELPSLNADNLTAASFVVLERFKQANEDLQRAAKLEVLYNRETRKWHLLFRVNVITYYRTLIAPQRNNRLFKEAIAYVEDIISKGPQDLTPPDELEHDTEVYLGNPNRCKFGAKCDSLVFNKKYNSYGKCPLQLTRDEHPVECTVAIPTTLMMNLPCGFPFYRDTVIPPLTSNGFMVTIRYNACRDLVLMPDIPIWEGSNHHNDDLVCDERMWTAALHAKRTLDTDSKSTEAVVGFTVNFGSWETGVNKDDRLKACHGHTHIYLSYGASRYLSTKCPAYKMLQGHTHYWNVEDHYFADCDQLMGRLTGKIVQLQMEEYKQEHKADMDALKTDMDSFKTELKTDITSLKADVEILKSGMNTILKALLTLNPQQSSPAQEQKTDGNGTELALALSPSNG